MSNQELLYLICLERVNVGGGSKYYSYYILTTPHPPRQKKKMNVNSFSKNSCTGSFISVDKTIKCKYHLNDFFKSCFTIHMTRMGLGRGWVNIL